MRLAALVFGALALAGCAEPVEQGWVQPSVPYGPPLPTQPGWVAPAQQAWAGVPPSEAPLYQRGRASYYSDRFAGRSTASRERYDPGALTAAHRTLPLGTVVDVARSDGRHVTVRINDRGPYGHGRIIDLSRRAASEIGMIRDGVADVVLRVLWMPRS